jgi:hypothetical protein
MIGSLPEPGNGYCCTLRDTVPIEVAVSKSVFRTAVPLGCTPLEAHDRLCIVLLGTVTVVVPEPKTSLHLAVTTRHGLRHGLRLLLRVNRLNCMDHSLRLIFCTLCSNRAHLALQSVIVTGRVTSRLPGRVTSRYDYIGFVLSA